MSKYYYLLVLFSFIFSHSQNCKIEIIPRKEYKAYEFAEKLRLLYNEDTSKKEYKREYYCIIADLVRENYFPAFIALLYNQPLYKKSCVEKLSTHNSFYNDFIKEKSNEVILKIPDKLLATEILKNRCSNLEDKYACYYLSNINFLNNEKEYFKQNITKSCFLGNYDACTKLYDSSNNKIDFNNYIPPPSLKKIIYYEIEFLDEVPSIDLNNYSKVICDNLDTKKIKINSKKNTEINIIINELGNEGFKWYNDGDYELSKAVINSLEKSNIKWKPGIKDKQKVNSIITIRVEYEKQDKISINLLNKSISRTLDEGLFRY